MKRNINVKISIILFIIFAFSCLLNPSKPFIKVGKLGDIIKSVRNKENSKEFFEPRLKKLIEGQVWALLSYYKWTKSGNPRPIRDEKNKIILELNNKLGYSYVFAPVDSKFASPFSIIVFETTKLGDEAYEVKELKLVSIENINFENYRSGIKSIPKVEKSKDSNYVNAYNFGVTDDTLVKSFTILFNNETKSWNYMLADLTLVNKLTHENETYRISLNPELFNDTIKLIKEKYKDASINVPIINDY